MLQLSADEAATLQDDAPFAAYGGDSLLAVQALPPYLLWLYSLHLQLLHLLWSCMQAISLARQHGLALPPPSRFDFEMASVDSLVQEGLLETARVAAPAGGTVGAGNAGGGAGGAGGAGGGTAPPAVRVSILERDGRDPMLKLRPGGGVSACAAGDLATARSLAAAGWQAAHAVDKHGNTALMWAAGSGRLEVVRWLLEDEGVAVRPAR